MTTATDETLDMATASVADVALHFPSAIDILNKYQLDYCCNGKKPFQEVCKKYNLNAEQIWFELQRIKADSGMDKRTRFETWNLSLLIDFILQNHHQYVRKAIPEIQELLDKVCNVHGDEQPSLHEIREDFNSLADELMGHMPKEEEILFPAIKMMLAQKEGTMKKSSLVPSLSAPITVMEHEHESAGDLIKSIRTLSDHYTPPSFACPTYQIAFKKLQEFDNDLMQHIHLENNILFPKSQLVNA